MKRIERQVRQNRAWDTINQMLVLFQRRLNIISQKQVIVFPEKAGLKGTKFWITEKSVGFVIWVEK